MGGVKRSAVRDRIVSAEHCSGQRQSGVKWSAVSKAERCSGQSLVKQSAVWDRDRAERCSGQRCFFIYDPDPYYQYFPSGSRSQFISFLTCHTVPSIFCNVQCTCTVHTLQYKFMEAIQAAQGILKQFDTTWQRFIFFFCTSGRQSGRR